MSALEITDIDLEQGTDHRHRRSSIDQSDVSTSDGESSCCSHFRSATGGSCQDHSFPDVEIELDSQASDSEGVSLDSEERNCRICHMGLESSSHECGVPIELGCSCKEDLGFVHKQCAEPWFKIKGNKTCEICHSIARNFAGANEIGSMEQPNGIGVLTAVNNPEAWSVWRRHRFLNFLLVCMVAAFVISWFFRFNMPSQR